jgi:PEP-CTERM motif
MKLFSAFLALVVLALLPANLHADTVSLTVDGTAVIGTPILNGYSFVYTNTTLGLLNNALLQESTSVVTATYVDVLGTLGVFNFTDICTKITVLGPIVPCQDLAISFTDVTLGDASIVAAIAANINVGVGVGDISIAGANLAPNFGLLGVSVAGASGEIDFQNPPPAVPEPGTLSLMATGLLGAAGVIRRKFGKA